MIVHGQNLSTGPQTKHHTDYLAVTHALMTSSLTRLKVYCIKVTADPYYTMTKKNKLIQYFCKTFKGPISWFS